MPKGSGGLRSKETKVRSAHWGYSAAVRSDPSQESGLEVLRKNDHDEAHALKAFHDFKRAVRIESLNRDTRLFQQKRHVHIPFVYYLELT